MTRALEEPIDQAVYSVAWTGEPRILDKGASKRKLFTASPLLY
jgi:hypothetical protein